MSAFTNILKVMLDSLAGLSGSYGVAIILMAFLIMLVTYPLNAKQMHFSYMMKSIQPKIDAIKKKHKDQNKANEEVMELWKEKGINPAAGCLPILIQMPIFIAMFSLLQQPNVFDQYPTFLGLSLTLPDATNSLFTIIQDKGILASAGYLILPVLAVVTTVLQQKQISTSNDSTSRTMTLFLPLFTAWLTIRYPTALGIYWVARNVFAIGQHYFFTQQMERKAMLEEAGAGDNAN